jgi:glycine hydroxymethyltransferase
MRGPRGGVILSINLRCEKKLQSAVFPGVQGSLHSQIIAAKAVCLGEALQPEFKLYGKKLKANAVRLAETLMQRGVKIVSDGTDTHIVLLDLSASGINGQRAQDALAAGNLTSNKNPIPFDNVKPSEWVGLRLGVGAVTTRGLGEGDMDDVGNMVADLIEAEAGGRTPVASAQVASKVARICQQYPAYC